MISDIAIVNLCAAIYSPIAAIQPWDHIDFGLDDGVCWGFRKLKGFDVVVFRGSTTAEDWFNDFRVIPLPTKIGHVHAGFYSGMEHVWSEVKPLITQPTIVTGHSLGAARAAVFTGLMVKDAALPVARVVFGEPKPGFIDLAKNIEMVPGRSYRNGDDLHHDLVTDVPFTLPPFQFVHPTPIIPVTQRPSEGLFSQFGIFAWHHIYLYQQALTNLSTKEIT